MWTVFALGDSTEPTDDEFRHSNLKPLIRGRHCEVILVSAVSRHFQDGIDTRKSD